MQTTKKLLLILFFFLYQRSLTQIIQIQNFHSFPCFQDSIQGTCLTLSTNLQNFPKGLYHFSLRLRLTSLNGTLIQTPDTFTSYSSFLDGQIWQLDDTFQIELPRNILQLPLQKSYFIPHYSLKLDSGTYTLRCNLLRIQIEKWDTFTQHFSIIPYSVEGETEFPLSVTLPAFIQARICVDTIEVAPYDHTYNNWDESLFLPHETLPDIQAQIVASTDTRFQFPVQPNTYLATYNRTCSPWIYWRIHDQVRLQVCDNDNSTCQEIVSLYLPFNQSEWKVYRDSFVKNLKYKIEISK